MDFVDLLNQHLEDRSCSKCGRRLTNPDSIDKGIGPVCEHNLTMKYGVIGLGHHPDRIDLDEAFRKFFTEFPEADFVVYNSGDCWFAYANIPDYPCIMRGAENEYFYGKWEYKESKVLEFRKQLKNTKLKFDCIHRDAGWLEFCASDYGYLGPYTHPYQDFVDENGWGPGLCSCMHDVFSQNEDYFGIEWEGKDFEDGNFTHALLEKLEIINEKAIWNPSYHEDKYSFAEHFSVILSDTDL
jgi:hypothetical protein